MLPSFFASENKTTPWSISKAAICGAAIGALAALFKTLGPLRGAGPAAMPVVAEIAAAAAAFGLLCALGAILRNFLARRLIWPGMG